MHAKKVRNSLRHRYYLAVTTICSIYSVRILGHALLTVILVKPVQMDKDPKHNGNELHWLSIQHKRASWEGTDEVQSILLMKAFNYKTQQVSCELMA